MEWSKLVCRGASCPKKQAFMIFPWSLSQSVNGVRDDWSSNVSTWTFKGSARKRAVLQRFFRVIHSTPCCSTLQSDDNDQRVQIIPRASHNFRIKGTPVRLRVISTMKKRGVQWCTMTVLRGRRKDQNGEKNMKSLIGQANLHNWRRSHDETLLHSSLLPAISSTTSGIITNDEVDIFIKDTNMPLGPRGNRDTLFSRV